MCLRRFKTYLDEAPVRRRLRVALLILAVGVLVCIWLPICFQVDWTSFENPFIENHLSADEIFSEHTPTFPDLRITVERTVQLLAVMIAGWVLIPLAERRA